ncbi:putative divalent heavy-metal cations transporter [Nitrosotalea sinensis]|uniref:Putative divalent heavy-metal cations transporter n=1 Tax=Nitrosotalea sinensis TaxID=1499975 RepID=A0A2H1EHI2_9ARCH|nr:ZIP family metal transporter [Candidatus Nitrosotalea sinensis]SHO46484.1 putative divalent heavy-metal cations transporter [Candidatus Nitrosotalea sinensis]
MIDYWQLLVLGAIAGFTIFLGLPVAALQNLSHKKKGFLNAFALGILVFLIIDVFSHGWETASTAATDAAAGKGPVGIAVVDLAALFGGIAIGLLGLMIYESKFMTKSFPQILSLENLKEGDDHLHKLFHEANAYKLATMIAVGIGAHNFSEGLAIGQSYVAGEIGLAIILIIGFGAHNATEGFGIAGPLTGILQRPNAKFLAKVGLIGGGPTFVGTMLGSLWISDIAYILFLSMAGGALVYVSMLMYNSGRKHTTNNVMMIGIFVGLCAGFITDLIVTLGGA